MKIFINKMNISGINRLIFYNMFGKRILLLGELHLEKGCPPEEENVIGVEEYIYELTERIPERECLDIFLEGSYKTRFIKGVRSGLEKTAEKLTKKISSQKF